MKTHKATQTLLADQTLCLHVDLANALSWQAAWLDNFLPLSDAEFLQC